MFRVNMKRVKRDVFCVRATEYRKYMTPRRIRANGVDVSKYPARQRAIAAAIKSARTQAGLTRIALSQKMGEHHTFISRVERLQREVTVAELEAIAKALDVPWLTIFKQAMR